MRRWRRISVVVWRVWRVKRPVGGFTEGLYRRFCTGSTSEPWLHGGSWRVVGRGGGGTVAGEWWHGIQMVGGVRGRVEDWR